MTEERDEINHCLTNEFYELNIECVSKTFNNFIRLSYLYKYINLV